MPDAVHHVFLVDGAPSSCDEGLMAFLYQPHELLGPQLLELSLQLGEGELDGVELRAVHHVEDVLEAELLHLLGGALVHAEVVHEQAQLLAGVLLPQVLQVLLEPRGVDGLGEDLEVLDALLLRNGGQQCQGRLTQPLLVDSLVLLGQGPLHVHDSLAGEHGLIQVDHPVAAVLRHGELPFHPANVPPSLFFCHAWGLLVPAELLLLDAVEAVDLPKQGGVQVAVLELLLEEQAPVLERE